MTTLLAILHITIEELAVYVGLAALFVSAIIAFRQERQLKKLKAISSDTKATADKLSAATVISGNVSKFFKLKGGSKAKFLCYFPVSYRRRPLPSIAEGDYFALYTISSSVGNLIGNENLILREVSKNYSTSIPKKHGVDEIFLCTPSTNSALRNIFPALQVKDTASLNITEFRNKYDLPCWFAEDHRKRQRGTEKFVKKIWKLEAHQQNGERSPAEEHYEQAYKLNDGERYTHASQEQEDYAIILRTKRNKHFVFVIAGIHQYGTWIAAEFLARAFRGKVTDKQLSDILFGDEDFLMVIWGQFISKELRVGDTDLYKNFAWTRNAGNWKQLERRVINSEGLPTSGQPQTDQRKAI